MGTPKDWVKESRSIGTYRAPQAFAGGPVVQEINPLDDIERMKRSELARRELEDLQNEADEDREDRRLQKQARRLQTQRQIDALTRPQASEDQGLFREIFAQMAQERKELMAELHRSQQNSSQALNSALTQQLKAMEQRLEALAQPQQTQDPIKQLVTSLQAVQEVRTAMDKVVPPPQISERQSRAERMEELRITEEAELRRLESEARIEDAKAAREAAQADRDIKAHRMERASSLVENTLAPLIARFGGDKIGGAIEGAMGGGEAGVAAADVAQDQQVPYTCPNPECQQVNYVPLGTTYTVCPHCKASFPLGPVIEDQAAEQEQHNHGPDGQPFIDQPPPADQLPG